MLRPTLRIVMQPPSDLNPLRQRGAIQLGHGDFGKVNYLVGVHIQQKLPNTTPLRYPNLITFPPIIR